MPLQERIEVSKERESKDDGRYIIFFAFGEGEEPEEEGEE